MSHKKRAIIFCIIHIVVIVGLIFSMTSITKNRLYLNAQKAFTEGNYEIFARYLNLSDRNTINLTPKDSTIPRQAFNDCKNLKYNEYKGCKYLESNGNSYYFLVSAVESQEIYEIHPDTTVICEGAFLCSKSIVEFVVPNENENFISVNGTLYSKDMSRLVHYATGNPDVHFDIPESVKIIDAYAFYYDSNLKSITLPNDLQKIGEYSFGYSMIESINIPNSAVIIEKGAFSNSAVKEITY